MEIKDGFPQTSTHKGLVGYKAVFSYKKRDTCVNLALKISRHALQADLHKGRKSTTFDKKTG